MSAEVKRAREAGQRASAKHGSTGSKSLLAPTLGVHSSELGESRLNLKQKYALEAMYQTNPAVAAARTVLHSQLLSGGLVMMRDGEVLDEVKFGQKNPDGSRKKGITKDWKAHLETYWLPFAKHVIDCFLKWGVAPVAFEVVQAEPIDEAIRNLKRTIGITTGKRKVEQSAPVLVPVVPALGTYEVAFRAKGVYGYSREYIVYSNAPGIATRVDDEAMVFVRDSPDNVGNLNGPLATVYDQASFVSSLVELAFTAEIARAQPSIVTQLRKAEKGTTLDTGALFFDSESRALDNDNNGEESQQAARSLEMQARLCEIINRLQTRTETGSGGAYGPSKATAFQPPEVPPKLFCLPKDHELAPHVQVPQPRGDLESLMRLSIDSFCSALGKRAPAHRPCTLHSHLHIAGVPSSLVFEGRFSNNSSTQLQLLNSTVSQLAKATNHVLTRCYALLYADDDGENEEPVQLKLMTSPLAVGEEVERLFTAGLIDLETALPAALHTLGQTPEEVKAALDRGKTKEEKRCACEDEARDLEVEDKKLNFQERSVGLEKTKVDIEKTKKEAQGLVKPPSANSSR